MDGVKPRSRAVQYVVFMGRVSIFKRSQKAMLIVPPFTHDPRFKCPVISDYLHSFGTYIQALHLLIFPLYVSMYLSA